MSTFHPLRRPFALNARAFSLVSGALSGLCLAAGSLQPVAAAERVTLTFGFAEISTSVEALRAYADTETIDPELAPYLDFLSAQQRSQFRQVLQARQDIDPVQMSRFLYSAIGENMLRYLGTIVQTEGRRDGTKGLRGALVLAAAEPNGLSLLGVLENFPTGNVRIDSLRAFRAVDSFTGLIRDTERAIAAMENQTSPIATIGAAVPPFPDLAQQGSFAVTTQDLTLVDEGRSRTLLTDLYLPELPAGQPATSLVVISHGLGGDRKGFAELAQHLASHGYAVAALDHPGSNRGQLEALLRGTAKEIARPTEFRDRPRDVSFLLDELTAMGSAGGTLAGRLRIEKVAMIGHSFGGYTALALAGATLDRNSLQTNCESDDFIFDAANPSMLLQCTALRAPEQFSESLRDPRIQAVMAINPVTSSLFGPTGFSQIAIPSLIVAGSNDPIAPALLEQIRPFIWLSEPAQSPSDLATTASPEATPTAALDNDSPDNSTPENDTPENSAPESNTESNTENLPEPISQPAHFLALIQGGSHLYSVPELESPVDNALVSGLVSADLPLAYSYLKAMSLGFLQAELDRNPAYAGALSDASIVQLGQLPLPLFLIESLTEAMLQPPPPAPEIAPTPEVPGSPEEGDASIPEPALEPPAQ